ncbi:SRPBCC family protein [Streptomyces tsukubensis]|uniref:Polyketide cyclase n=1 Tax=Streptomyces tsukubensis TaxID=83656 RepID=A0A1V4AFS9_9ACTN|nr:SRPBCC family protein [Streptomyces tsukubensis]OON82528.1 polyketide cyclase [Streptomyces tsukubensis]QFR92312.1 SRPBCC family protein [Streptomyces tsukubensis]
MTRTLTVSGGVVVDAPADTVYDHVSDPMLMGQWSPENLGARVRERRERTYVGMVFEGHNRRGPVRWTTRCTVTAAERGRLFAFRVHAIGLRRPRLPGSIATWEYRFEPAEGGGTLVTETWQDDRRAWPDAVAGAFDRAATRGHTFADFQRRNIRTTLDNLKKAMEQPGTRP